MTLKNKVALVTGGAQGLGKAIALAMARAGADVAIGYRRDRASADSAAQEVEALGRKAYVHQVDVREGEAVHAFVEGARGALGGLDVVVANAGVPTRFQPLQDVDPGYWQRVIDIDLTGVFHTLHAALPILREQEDGVILTVSSVAADLCGPFGGPYVAAKAGVNALTKVIARENAGKNVRCNVIAPGLIQTDIADGMFEQHGDELLKPIPLGRIGTSEEVAELAVYLASPDAAWITGKIFRIDGGQFI
jgi:3-oxoacyl-[acyl-carrier protein] reductase